MAFAKHWRINFVAYVTPASTIYLYCFANYDYVGIKKTRVLFVRIGVF